MKRLDPYHILYSPITGSTLGRAWHYQAATAPPRGGSPAFDVYTFEHYDLPSVGGGLTTAQMLQEYPLDFAPCWAMGEASGQRDGNFPAESTAELTVQDWVAFIGGGVRGQLWFDLSYSVNNQIIEAASAVGIKLAALADGILSPVGVSQPHATSSVAGVHARAFWKDKKVEDGQVSGDFFVAVVNERLAPIANASVSVVLSNGESGLGTATISVPFETARTVAGAASTTRLITEPLGSYEGRVYLVEGSEGSGAGASSLATADVELSDLRDSNLVTNADFAAQTLVGTPDRWLLFPTQGTPAGGMDLHAVLMSDHAAARRGSNTSAALRIVLSNPLGTGIHLPLEVDHTGLSPSTQYNLSFWAKTNAVVGTAVLVLARSSRVWHYGDSSPTLLEDVEAFVLSTVWQRYSTTLHGVNGTLNLLPRNAGALWISEPSLVPIPSPTAARL